MKKFTSALVSLGLAISLSGCVGQGEESICKSYFKAYGDMLAGMLEGTSGELEFADSLRELSKNASGDLKAALLADAAAAPDGSSAAGICKKYLAG